MGRRLVVCCGDDVMCSYDGLGAGIDGGCGFAALSAIAMVHKKTEPRGLDAITFK